MMYFITSYVLILGLNYLAVFLMEKTRWDILDELNYSTRTYYFRQSKLKNYSDYLVWLQFLVAIPFKGLYESIIFFIRFNQALKNGYNKRDALYLATGVYNERF